MQRESFAKQNEYLNKTSSDIDAYELLCMYCLIAY